MSRFIPLAEVAAALGKSVSHLRSVAEDQNGIFRKPRHSGNLRASYPRFRLVGRRWGVAEPEWIAFQVRIGLEEAKR